MDAEAKKKYIKKTWSTSSGKRITAMLQKYWNLEPQENIIKTAKEIFEIQ